MKPHLMIGLESLLSGLKIVKARSCSRNELTICGCIPVSGDHQPLGGVTVGEDYLTSAKKELSEELGLDVEKENAAITQIDKHLYGTAAEDDGLRMLAVFLVHVDWPLEKFIYPENEVAALKWISKEVLRQDLQEHPEKYLPHANTWKRYLI